MKLLLSLELIHAVTRVCLGWWIFQQFRRVSHWLLATTLRLQKCLHTQHVVVLTCDVYHQGKAISRKIKSATMKAVGTGKGVLIIFDVQGPMPPIL